MKADKFALYLKSVQTPKKDAQFLTRRFRKLTGRPLRLLREDFCGTANLICEFVRLHPDNRGIGVDSDTRPLRWCKANNFQRLSCDQQKRLLLHHADVLKARTPAVDMIVALNFSYSVFKKRSDLLRYLKAAKRALVPRGVFLLDVHGGSAVAIEDREAWDMNHFHYVWEVSKFDPISNQIVCKIHFAFPDGTYLHNAFVYDWRLWSIPELQELFEDAGFRNVHVLWEGTDSRTNMGNGVLRKVQRGHAEGAWYAMVVGQK